MQNVYSKVAVQSWHYSSYTVINREIRPYKHNKAERGKCKHAGCNYSTTPPGTIQFPTLCTYMCIYSKVSNNCDYVHSSHHLNIIMMWYTCMQHKKMHLYIHFLCCATCAYIHTKHSLLKFDWKLFVRFLNFILELTTAGGG